MMDPNSHYLLVRVAAFVVPLGFGTFAIAVALGLRGMAPWWPAVVFSVFEATMPVAGIIAGRFVGNRFAVFAELLGGLILVGVGTHTFLGRPAV